MLFEACRGKHLDFAARGADLTAAVSGQPEGFAAVRGTSFAAPIVAGLLARELPRTRCRGARPRGRRLLAGAEDLGPRGRDDIYGAGLVGGDPQQLAAQ